MKKTIAILFSAAIICGSFTACGKKEKGSSTTESSTMAPTNSDSGLNSATDASQESAGDIPGNASDVTGTGTDKTTESSDGLIDGIVSDGEKVADDIVTAIEDVGDAVVGNDN